ncbi:MAG: hypothetical protein AB7I48_24735 [Planctomycetaceae bacterium]
MSDEPKGIAEGAGPHKRMNRVEHAALDVMREHALKLHFNAYGHSINDCCLEIRGATTVTPSAQRELIDAVTVLAKGHVTIDVEGTTIAFYPLDQYGASQEAADLRGMATRLADAGINYPGSEDFKTRTPD